MAQSKYDAVDDFYKRILGRVGDVEGQSYWSSHPASTSEIEAEFYRSPEGIERRVPQREQANAVLPGYLYPGNQFYGFGPEYLSAARNAVAGINRMPGVFSDYGSMATMPGADIHKMFFPKGTGISEAPSSGRGGRGGESDMGGAGDDMLARLFAQLSPDQRQTMLSYLLNITQGAGE